MTSSDSMVLFGTTQARPEVRRLTAGALSLDLENGAIRYVTYGGHEAIRGIDYLQSRPEVGGAPIGLQRCRHPFYNRSTSGSAVFEQTLKSLSRV